MSAPGLCGDCLRDPPLLAETRAVFVYGFPLDRLVPRFKFHRDLAAGRLMADLMAGALTSAPRPDALVPVPLHARRIRQRGYDQALELARPLAATLALPLRADLLQRIRATAAQSELDAGQRRRNLARAFAVPKQAALPDHVALVDDVMTTGATLAAAAHALRAAGVERVDAWVCARVPGSRRRRVTDSRPLCPGQKGQTARPDRSRARPANTAAPTQLLCRKARKQASRPRWRASTNSHAISSAATPSASR